MAWSAAERLLERAGDPDRDPSAPCSMATFANNEQRCSCEVCRPDLNRKKSPKSVETYRASGDIEGALAALRPSLIVAARVQLQNRGLDAGKETATSVDGRGPASRITL